MGNQLARSSRATWPAYVLRWGRRAACIRFRSGEHEKAFRFQFVAGGRAQSGPFRFIMRRTYGTLPVRLPITARWVSRGIKSLSPLESTEMNRSELSFVPFATTVQRLQSLYLGWHHVFRCEAGWLAGLASYRHKFLLGRTLYEDAVNATNLRQRLAEVQCHQPERSEPPAIGAFATALSTAPSAEAVFVAVLRDLRETWMRAIYRHLEQTDPVLDWPSHHLLRHAKLDLQNTRDAFDALQPAINLNDAEAAWVARIVDLAEVALELKPECELPVPAAEEHWLAPPFAESAREPGRSVVPAHEVRAEAPPKSDALAYERYEFLNHAFELMFAESLATTIYETLEMPWEFHADLARQAWDELRHAEGGYRRCEQLGLPRDQVPQVNTNYAVRQTLDPLHRFCLMTLISEASGFRLKRERLKGYAADGNSESERFMAFDLADEGAHVSYGHVWVPIMMKQFHKVISLEELKERCKVFIQSGGYSFEEDRFTRSPVFAR